MADPSTASKPCSVLIKNGIVIDPSNNIDSQSLDVLLVDGRVARVAPSIPVPPTQDGSCDVYDASGCLVCPGLIDLHVHCYPGRTSLGVEPDEHCLGRGVTTVVDAGSSGLNDMEDFVKFIKTRKTRVFCFIHASKVGLTQAGCANAELPGELSNLVDVDIDGCLECIDTHSDCIVGVKIRLSAQLANDGQNEPEACRRALEIRSKAGLPLMVHYSFSTIPHVVENGGVAIPGSLGNGDILTHLYHGFTSTILDVPAPDPLNLTVHYSIPEARVRGVYLDIGHGMGGFNWKVAEVAARQGVWPDTISTDLHTSSIDGPAYDLPTLMTKLLFLGMPLYEVVKAVTYTPAKVINKHSMIGSLGVGSYGDVTVLRLVDCDVMLEDCNMNRRRVMKRFVPMATWVGGERYEIKELRVEWPNNSEEFIKKQSAEIDMLVKELNIM